MLLLYNSTATAIISATELTEAAAVTTASQPHQQPPHCARPGATSPAHPPCTACRNDLRPLTPVCTLTRSSITVSYTLPQLSVTSHDPLHLSPSTYHNYLYPHMILYTISYTLPQLNIFSPDPLHLSPTPYHKYLYRTKSFRVLHPRTPSCTTFLRLDLSPTPCLSRTSSTPVSYTLLPLPVPSHQPPPLSSRSYQN